MAVQITVEFTDAQWALVQLYFPHTESHESGKEVYYNITEEELTNLIFTWIKTDVVRGVEATAKIQAVESVTNCFDI